MDQDLTPDEKDLLLTKLNEDLKWLEKYEGEKNE